MAKAIREGQFSLGEDALDELVAERVYARLTPEERTWVAQQVILPEVKKELEETDRQDIIRKHRHKRG
jgi:hypothetical protein